MLFIENIAKLKSVFTIFVIEIVYIFKTSYITKVSTNCDGNWIKNEMWESN